jgi:type IV secretion system protein TrbL
MPRCGWRLQACLGNWGRDDGNAAAHWNRQDVHHEYYASMRAGIDLKEMAIMLIATFVLMYLTNKVPPRIPGIVGVGGVGSIGGVGVGSVMAAAGMTASAAAAGGAAVVAGAPGAAGGASAIKAAFQSAQQNMVSGSGMFSGSSGGGSGSVSGGSNGFMSAMGAAGRFAADIGANVAKGVGRVAADKASSIVVSAKEQIADTTGGKIASAIRNSGASGAGQESVAGDSLGSGADRVEPANDEVAAFVNKRPVQEHT